MSRHLDEMREMERRTKTERKKNTRMAHLLILLGFFCISLCILVGVMFSVDSPIDGLIFGNNPEKLKQTEGDDLESHLKGTEQDWQLIIISRKNLLPKNFTVDLAKIGTYSFDYRILDPLNDMISDAEKDGISLTITSGYRSITEQKTLYDNKLEYYAQKGFGNEACVSRTLEYIQYPGASEHHTGLAVDFVTDEKTSLNESFADTPAYNWLGEHAQEYGFIERYPQSKSNATGINWEPWHYRYVGKLNSKAMKSLGICLEEYV